MTIHQLKKVSVVITDQEYLTSNKPPLKVLIINKYPLDTTTLYQNGTIYHPDNKTRPTA